MIDLEHGRLVLNGNTTAIRYWQVWFMTPFGLLERLQDAVDKCKERDLDPLLMIKAVPVAIDKDGQYEMVV